MKIEELEQTPETELPFVAETIATGLLAGTKYTTDVLEWFVSYQEERFFPRGRRIWRHRRTETLYFVEGINLRVGDAAIPGTGGPVMLSVDYSPLSHLNEDGSPVVNAVMFNRTLADFVRKFEPVHPTRGWGTTDVTIPPVPGALIA